MIPVEEFQRHLVSYYNSAWIFIVIAQVLAIASIVLALKKTRFSDKIISFCLAYLWLLDGIVHQLILGTFPPGQKYTIVILFTLQGILFLFFGVFKSSLSFHFEGSIFSIVGVLFVLYSMSIYPILAALFGHPIPKGPIVGVICPSTIFTFGMLLWTKRGMSKIAWIVLLAIPLIWAVVGGLLAVVHWQIWEDIGLVAAGIIGTLMLLFRSKEYKPEK
jgi:hypothetical protein